MNHTDTDPYTGEPPIPAALAALEHATGRDLALGTAVVLDRIALAAATTTTDTGEVAALIDAATTAAHGLATQDGHPDVADPLMYLRAQYRARQQP